MCVKDHQGQQGFSYIGVLILVAIMGVMLAATGDMWQTTQQREKEDELLFAGHQFRQAIQRYYQQSPGQKSYPKVLGDLLQDPRLPAMRRYLRRIYYDPMTGTSDWGLVTGPSGEIYGVYSKSDAEPLKKANFGYADSTFEGATKYSQWQFVFLPRPSTVVPPPVVPPAAIRPVVPAGIKH